MAKKLMIIEDCLSCHYHSSAACWNSKIERYFTDEEDKLMDNDEYFPSWCPLEDYKDGNENK